MTYRLKAETLNGNYVLDEEAATEYVTVAKADMRLTINDVFVFRNTSIEDARTEMGFTVSGLVGKDIDANVREDIIDGFELTLDSRSYNPNAVLGSKFNILYTTPTAANYNVTVSNGSSEMNGTSFVSSATVTIVSQKITVSGTPQIDVTSWVYGETVELNARGCSAKIGDKNGEADFSGEILYAYSETLDGTYRVGTPVNAGHYYVKGYVAANEALGYGYAYSDEYVEV